MGGNDLWVDVQNNQLKMHHIGWNANYFKTSDVSLLVFGCVVSQYSQLYETSLKYISNITLYKYLSIYEGEKGNMFLK